LWNCILIISEKLSIARGATYLAHRFFSSHKHHEISYLGRSTPPDLSALSEKIVAVDLARSMDEFRLSEPNVALAQGGDNKSENQD
jgi:hypothetical protein